MKLTDLLPLAEWIALEDEIYELSGLQSSVFDTDGIRITNNKRWANKLCPEIKADDRGQSYICAVAHMNMAAQARSTQKPVVGECDAGLVKFVVPIFSDDEFLGTAGGCGLLMTDGEVDNFMVNKTIDMEEARIQMLSDGIPLISEEKLDSIAETIRQRINEMLTHRENGEK
jgi:ligand-binding sensor protein